MSKYIVFDSIENLEYELELIEEYNYYKKYIQLYNNNKLGLIFNINHPTYIKVKYLSEQLPIILERKKYKLGNDKLMKMLNK